MANVDELIALGAQPLLAERIVTRFVAKNENSTVASGATQTVAGTLDVTGTFQIGGVTVTSSAAELNIMDGVTATAAEINVLAGVTAGTVTASKGLVVDGSKTLDTLVVTTPRVPINTYASDQAIAGAGIALLGTIATAQSAFTLPAPTAATLGTELTLIASTASTSQTVTTNATSVKINYTGNTILTFNTIDQSVTLKQITTTQWAIKSNVGSVAAS